MRKNWKKLTQGYLKSTNSPLIVILGPTASGKTSFSIDVAKFINNAAAEDRDLPLRNNIAEVVNADSRQLYRGLDIGTAKITEKEMEGVPHHLIDILDPNEEAAAGWYQTEASRVIGEIRERGNTPLLVGGSMLYLSTITDDLSMNAPTPDPETRSRLMAEYDQDDGETLYKRLCEIDPDTAARIHQNNQPRLIRAVEICELLGHKPQASSVPRTELRPRDQTDQSDSSDILIFGIQCPREELIERINKRTELMFESGWIEEVQGLIDQGYTAQDYGMKSTGYREIVEYLSSENGDLSQLKETIAAKTRQYARRQMTWWKRDDRINWV